MKNCMCIFLNFLLLTSICSFAQQNQTSEELVTMAREFVVSLEQENFSEAVKNFDATMRKVSPPEKLKEVWEMVIGQVGKIKRQLGARMESLPKYDIVYITCEFERASLDIKVVFDKEKKIAGQFFVPSQSPANYKKPAYVKPSSFEEKDVLVGFGEWILPGTLTLPLGKGPFPAVVLVHGSGPNDRDETIGPNKPFRDLAWGLASQKIAVLRYEKRTKAHSKKLVSSKEIKLTVKEETIDDALAAVELLRKTDKIDTRRIFVLGHSLGGMLVPRIAARGEQIAGFIVMAGVTRPLEDVILEQVNYIVSLDGKISDAEKAKLDEIEKAVKKIKALKPSDSLSMREKILGAPPEYWLDLRGYNPPVAASKMRHSMLILQGGRDYQVKEEDFKAWKKYLSVRKNVHFRFYPELNHLFFAGKGKISPSEYQKTGNVAKIVVDDIANWIKK